MSIIHVKKNAQCNRMGFKYLTYMGEMCGEYTALDICDRFEMCGSYPLHPKQLQAPQIQSDYYSKAAVKSKIELVGD